MSLTILVPLMGYNTDDMFQPLRFPNQSLATKIVAIRKMVADASKHVDFHGLKLYLKSKYSHTGVSDKLDDETTLKQVMDTIQRAHLREIKGLEEDCKGLKGAEEAAQKNQTALKAEHTKLTAEKKALSKKRAQKRKETIAMSKTAKSEMSLDQKRAYEKLKAENKSYQDRDNELDEKLLALNMKEKAARERVTNTSKAYAESKAKLSESKSRRESAARVSKLTLVGIKSGKMSAGGDQQVKMLDTMVGQIRKRRSDAGARMEALQAELKKVNAKIDEMETKRKVITDGRQGRKEQVRRLEMMQEQSIKQFDELIRLSKKIVHSSNSTKSRIDGMLAKTRLGLARGYTTDSHRKNARGKGRGSTLKKTTRK